MTVELTEENDKKFIELNGEDLETLLAPEIIEAIDFYKEENEESHDMGLTKRYHYKIAVENDKTESE